MLRIFELSVVLSMGYYVRAHEEVSMSCEIDSTYSGTGTVSGSVSSNSLKRLIERVNQLESNCFVCKKAEGGEFQATKKPVTGVGGGGWGKPAPGTGVGGGVKTGSKDCDNLYREGSTTDGVSVVPINGKDTEIYCEFNKDGYNWLVFLRRKNGYLDFYRDWKSYVNGFGDAVNEYWLGLENLYQLTSTRRYVLRVELEDFSYRPNKAYAEYSDFSIGDASSKYTLNVGGYSGDARDAMSYSNNRPFTTKDNDNDAESYNCAVRHHGAWWYKGCHDANLMGEYLNGGQISDRGVNWWYWKDNYYSVRRAVMKMRPR